jgi:hypothetical protein
MEFIEAPPFGRHLARYLDDEQYRTPGYFGQHAGTGRRHSRYRRIP